MQDLHWRNIWSADNPVEALNEHLLLLVGPFVPTKVIRVRNKDKPWFDDQCRHAFGLKQEAHLRWTRDRSRVNWEEFVCCQVRANEPYSETKGQCNARNRAVLMNAKFVVSEFVTATACWWKWWTDLLSDHFDGKQSRESVDLPLTFHPSPRLTSFAFGSSEVRRLLLDAWTLMGALTHWVRFVFFF